jgi:hypothetical protein
MAAEKAEILEYLLETRAFFLTYHNHKEASAWVGTAAFLPVVTLLMTAISKISPKIPVLGRFNILGTLVLTAFGIIFLIYVRKQLIYRKLAATINEECSRWIAQILEGNLSPADVSFILRDRQDSYKEQAYFLPASLLDKIKGRRKIVSRSLTRTVWAYMVLTYLLALAWLWFSHR